MKNQRTKEMCDVSLDKLKRSESYFKLRGSDDKSLLKLPLPGKFHMSTLACNAYSGGLTSGVFSKSTNISSRINPFNAKSEIMDERIPSL